MNRVREFSTGFEENQKKPQPRQPKSRIDKLFSSYLIFSYLITLLSQNFTYFKHKIIICVLSIIKTVTKEIPKQNT